MTIHDLVPRSVETIKTLEGTGYTGGTLRLVWVDHRGGLLESVTDPLPSIKKSGRGREIQLHRPYLQSYFDSQEGNERLETGRSLSSFFVVYVRVVEGGPHTVARGSVGGKRLE